MKRFTLAIWLLIASLCAAQTQQRIDFPRLAPIRILKANGQQVVYPATTDADRGSALERAFAALVAGDEMHIAKGDYTGVDEMLVVPSNVAIIGHGAHIKLAGGLTTTPWYTIKNSDPTNGNTNIRISGLHLDGNNTENTDTTKEQRGIRLAKVTNFRVVDNWIEHYGRLATISCMAINPVTCSDGVITGNRMEDVVDGINTGDISAPCTRLTIMGNVVLSTNRDYPINLFWCNNSTIVGNVLRNASKEAIHVLDSSNNVIANNVIDSAGLETDNTYSGIAVKIGTLGSNDNLIVGNTIRKAAAGNNASYGINLPNSGATRTQVIGNDLYSSGDLGGLLNNGANTVRRGNKLNDGLTVDGEPKVVTILVSDPNGSALTTGDGKAFFRVPATVNGYNLVAAAAAVTTVSSSGLPTIQIHNLTQTADMLTTRITIDASEKDSKDATDAVEIDTGNDDVATGDQLRIDVDVAGTGTKGLITELTFQLP